MTQEDSNGGRDERRLAALAAKLRELNATIESIKKDYAGVFRAGAIIIAILTAAVSAMMGHYSYVPSYVAIPICVFFASFAAILLLWLAAERRISLRAKALASGAAAFVVAAMAVAWTIYPAAPVASVTATSAPSNQPDCRQVRVIEEISTRSSDLEVPGLGSVTTKWSKLAEFSGELGKAFKARLENDRESTWYVITMSPYAYRKSGLLRMFDDATGRGIDVLWAYQAPDDVINNPTLQHMWRWLYSAKPIEQRTTRESLCFELGGLARTADRALTGKWRADKLGDAGKWINYHSLAPTFYLVWLSVPKLDSLDPDRAPAGTFGFVMPYAYFPTYDDRPGFYFDSSRPGCAALEGNSLATQSLLDYYYRSTRLFFSEGVKPGPYQYLKPTAEEPGSPADSREYCHKEPR